MSNDFVDAVRPIQGPQRGRHRTMTKTWSAEVADDPQRTGIRTGGELYHSVDQVEGTAYSIIPQVGWASVVSRRYQTHCSVPYCRWRCLTVHELIP